MSTEWMAFLMAWRVYCAYCMRQDELVVLVAVEAFLAGPEVYVAHGYFEDFDAGGGVEPVVEGL